MATRRQLIGHLSETFDLVELQLHRLAWVGLRATDHRVQRAVTERLTARALLDFVNRMADAGAYRGHTLRVRTAIAPLYRGAGGGPGLMARRNTAVHTAWGASGSTLLPEPHASVRAVLRADERALKACAEEDLRRLIAALAETAAMLLGVVLEIAAAPQEPAGVE